MCVNGERRQEIKGKERGKEKGNYGTNVYKLLKPLVLYVTWVGATSVVGRSSFICKHGKEIGMDCAYISI